MEKYELQIGTKIVCIKSYQLLGCIYEVGDIFTIVRIYVRPNQHYDFGAKKENDEQTDNFTFSEIEKNYITMAEWRDKQIDKILEDE
jgi:hypothetical protein